MAFTLRRRILLAVSPLLILLALLGSGGSYLLVQLGRRGEAIMSENYDSVKYMDLLLADLHAIDRSFHHPPAGDVAEYERHWQSARVQIESEARNVTILPEEPLLVTTLRQQSERYRERGDAYFRYPPTGDARRTALAELRDLHAELDRTAWAIRDLNETDMLHASRDAKATAQRSVVAFGIALAASIAAGLASVWWLNRSILGPIQSVTAAATAIGAGQLNRTVPVFAADELGQLAESFNAMTQKLREYRQSNTERLLRARATSQATIDSFPDPIVVIDPLGRVEFANPASQRVLGVPLPQEGQESPNWAAPASLVQPLTEALRDERPVLTDSFEQAVNFRLDGEEHSYLPQVRPIRSPAGETLGAAIVLTDVTRFRLLDRLKSDWVATVSHELKTPLTSVRLAVHVLLEEIVGPLETKQVELLIEARDSTERLLKLIEHLLALAKLEDGREQLQLQTADPAELLRTAADLAASRAEDKRIAIEIADATDVPKILADPQRLGHALNNLLDNAITYTEPGGQVALSASAVGTDRVRITVEDSGIGIPTDYLPHIFDRFFRVPGRDQHPGTGLGLAIVREIVEAHRGSITCRSEVGHGTAFDIVLPIREVQP